MNDNKNDSSTGGYLRPTAWLNAEEDDKLENLFQAAFVGVTGLPIDLVRPEYQETPPNQPSITTNWMAFYIEVSESDDAIAMRHDPDGDGGLGATNTYINQHITVRMVFYGPRARMYASVLQNGFKINQNWEALNKEEIRYNSWSAIMQTSERINGQFVRRVDLTLYAVRQTIRTYKINSLVGAGGIVHTNEGFDENFVVPNQRET